MSGETQGIRPESSNQLLETAHERLHPSLQNPNFLVLRSRRTIFETWIQQLRGQNLRVLDVGGRYQPYRPLFAARARRYVACDIRESELVDVVASGEALPFESGTYDVIVCTQVFEYFDDPHAAAREMHRVLTPQGALFMSAVSCGPRFVEEEQWRFTSRGLRSLLAPFQEVTILPEVSSAGGLLRTLNLGLYTLAPEGPLRRLVQMTACPCLNLTGMALERMALTSNDQFAPNYSVLAIK
jgi:SAM-dependent methyltransferase